MLKTSLLLYVKSINQKKTMKYKYLKEYFNVTDIESDENENENVYPNDDSIFKQNIMKSLCAKTAQKWSDFIISNEGLEFLLKNQSPVNINKDGNYVIGCEYSHTNRKPSLYPIFKHSAYFGDIEDPENLLCFLNFITKKLCEIYCDISTTNTINYTLSAPFDDTVAHFFNILEITHCFDNITNPDFLKEVSSGILDALCAKKLISEQDKEEIIEKIDWKNSRIILQINVIDIDINKKYLHIYYKSHRNYKEFFFKDDFDYTKIIKDEELVLSLLKDKSQYFDFSKFNCDDTVYKIKKTIGCDFADMTQNANVLSQTYLPLLYYLFNADKDYKIDEIRCDIIFNVPDIYEIDRKVERDCDIIRRKLRNEFKYVNFYIDWNVDRYIKSD